MAHTAGKWVQRAAVVRQPVPSPVLALRPVAPQASGMRVSSPQDAAEVEAVSVAAQVVRMPAPGHLAPAVPARGASGAPLRSPWVARLAPHIVQRRGQGSPAVSPQAAADISAARGAGQPLPAAARAFMEPRFRADFSTVRVHTDTRAQRLAGQLQAQAFTVGGDIFFGPGRFAPDSAEGRELLAHELTHTLQQGAAVRRSEATDGVPVQASTPQPEVQRLGLSDALDYFAEHANHLPGFRMLTVVLGMNPITMRAVDRSPANILRAVVEFLPGGHLLTQALDNHGIFERMAVWVAQQFTTLGMVAGMFRQAIDRFLDSLSWSDIFDLGDVFRRALNIITAPIDRLIAFGRGLLAGIVELIKQAILRPLGRLAEGTRGWDLLRGVLGFDPVTGDAVPRTPALLIGGFMRLIGQEEIWDNIQRSNAIGRAWAWFQGALGDLLGFVRQIPTLFIDALRSLSLPDIVQLPAAFVRVGRVFGDFIGRFLAWAGNTVWNLLEIVFSVVAPGVMVYLRRAAGAFRTILRDPIGFVRNLVRAAVSGLRQFASNVLAHLRASLIGWLTGALGGAGVYIPQSFSLMEIVKFVLSVLGLTWQNIRAKLVRAVGEPAVRAMETGFDIVATLVTQGPAAAWQRIVESLNNLREMVIEQVMAFVQQRIVQAAITRLVMLLNPAGAFIQAVIAIYNTVMFFIERLRQIAQVAASFIDSIAAIAAGQIGAAANRVEQTMAGLLTLVISFLARLVGLGRVSDAVTNIINRVRQPIDRALDRVVDWIVSAARRLGRFVAQAGVPNDPNQRLRLGMQAAMRLINARPAGRPLSAGMVQALVAAVRVRYGFQVLEAVQRGARWFLRGVVNPTLEEEISEQELELLNRIYAVADAEYAAARARRGPLTGAGTHASPLAMPASGGLVAVAANLPDTPARGSLTVVDVTQSSAIELRGAIRRPPFGDFVVSGASPTERRVRVGAYREVAAQLSSFGNDRYVAEAAIEVMRGGDLPPPMRELSPWFGGFKTLMAVEVRRDPIALATLSSVLALAGAGALPISAAFARADEDAEQRRTAGGLFPHSAAPALGPLRGAREAVGAPLPEGAPASRGSEGQRINALRNTIDAVVRGAQMRLRTRHTPGPDEIVTAVRQVMRETMAD